MTRRAQILLIVTALCWGSSFAFMKIAVDDFGPATMMSLRCAIGAAFLWPAVVFLERRRGISGRAARGAPGRGLLLNGLLTAAPFFAIAWGIQHIDSGLAGIVNASVPLWSALLALHWDQAHSTTRQRALGVAVGFAGVVLLFAVRGAIGASGEVAGLLACALGALLYAISGIFVRERLGHVSAPRVAAWAVTWAAVLLAVPAAVEVHSFGSADTASITAVVILGIVGTGLGMLGYYELLAEAGATRASLVTYLLPPMAVAYGAVLLDEAVRPEGIAAMAVILVGVWMAGRQKTRVVPT